MSTSPAGPTTDGTARVVDRAHRAVCRRRPLPGQACLRRDGRGRGRRVRRRPRRGGVRAAVPAGIAERLAARADGSGSATIAGERSSPCERLGRYRYTIVAWVDHSRDLARGSREEACRRAGRERRPAARSAARTGSGGTRPVARRARRLEEWALSLGAADATISEPGRLRASRRAARPRAALPRSRAGGAARAAARRRPSTASARASRPGTRCFRARPPRRPARTARSPTARRACPTSPRWASMCSTCRPIHPIGDHAAQGRQQPHRRRPGRSGQPLGDRQRSRAATRPFTRDLGTLEDFRRLLARAAELGIEIALDLAFQCSPDHPYVREHPEWFLERPDGTIQYAENPPKKYQDIYPFDFETRRLAGAVGGARRASSSSGSSRACASSASTIRTPSRSRSGSG